MMPASTTTATREKPEAEGKKEQLLRELEQAGAELEARGPERATAWDKGKRKWVMSEVAGSSRPRSPGHSRGEGDRDQGDEAGATQEGVGSSGSAGGGEEAVPRCHLHPPKKPNAKCKFCQRALAATAAATQKSASPAPARSESQAQPEAKAKANEDVEDYSRRSFNCSPMLKDQILGSHYFKNLLNLTALDDLVSEIGRFADTFDVYNAGSTVSPSCFICQVYRLFTLPQAEDIEEVLALVETAETPVVRCAGFLYMRFVVPPAHLWEKMEEYLFDDMALQIPADHSGGKTWNTIGEYVEGLLSSDRYYNTPLPRIPVKVRQALERELAPLPQYRKRMEANQKTFRTKRIANLPVEVRVEGSWVPGLARDYIGRARRKIAVKLEDGRSVTTHLGKVVLREDGAESASGGESSGEEGGKKRGKRSRSRRRGASERDWSRWKGKDETEMVEEFRERHREEAVCGYGKAYARRPFTVEEELWRREPETRVSMLGDDGTSQHRRPSSDGLSQEVSAALQRRTREEQAAYAQRMKEIYEKYGSASKSSASSAAGGGLAKEIDGPDVLRLG